MRIVLKNFRLVDEETDMNGALIIDDGVISAALPSAEKAEDAAFVIDGRGLSPGGLPVLMPAFVDLHAHFRDPGFPEKETIESASLAAAAGGFCTVVCMANTRPVIDTVEKVRRLENRSGALGLVDLYPVMSLSAGMEGSELSGITALAPGEGPLMLSEDGKDMASDDLFLAAMKEAKRLGVPISCHCDFGADENNAVRRAIELGMKAGCHIHIAHVSAGEAVETIRQAKAAVKAAAKTAASGIGSGFVLTCEAMPHNLCLTEEDAAKLGADTWGRVNPPLRSERDRMALIRALADGTVDAVATDHAPHSAEDKERGAPGFSGFETAFAAVYTELVRSVPRNGAGSGGTATGVISLKYLSSLMSARPARLLGLGDGARNGARKRGRLLPGYRADLVIVDTESSRIAEPAAFKTRGKNTPFAGKELFGTILMTMKEGRFTFML